MSEITENSVGPDDVWKLLQELIIQSKETDRQLKQTDRQLKRTDRQLQESKAENDRQMQLLRQELGKLGGRLGEFVQEMVKPAVVRLFQQRGIEVHEVHPNITLKRDGLEAEVDLLVVNDGISIAVECKSHCSVDDVNEHLQRLDKLKILLPYYKATELMGCIAAMVMPDDVARYAYRKGLYVLAQSGETMLVRNDDKFKPKIW